MKHVIFTSILIFGLSQSSCKSTKSAGKDVSQQVADHRQKVQLEMEAKFILEHDYFIRLQDKTLKKDELPYPQLHILIDSIQDFRNMHGALLYQVDMEQEIMAEKKLSKEARQNVQQRIDDRIAESAQVEARFKAICGQIANLKMLHRIKYIDGSDKLMECRLQADHYELLLKHHDLYLIRLAEEIEQAGQNDEKSTMPFESARYHDLLSVHNENLKMLATLKLTLSKAESALGGKTIFEGPFIPRHPDIVLWETVILDMEQSVAEYDLFFR